MSYRLRRQIVALGGGGFSNQSRRLLLEEYILAQSGKRRPKICFIPTASGDAPDYIARFYSKCRKLSCMPADLALFEPTVDNFASVLLKQDVIFVGGGNTRNMLALWKLWELDAALKAAYERGVILAGTSAGALCWFRSGLTDSFPRRYAPMKCLGLLVGSFCPHYDSEAKRRPFYRRLIAEKALAPGFGVDDGVALHFVDGRLHRAVAARRGARAYHVVRRAGRPDETEILPTLLN